MSTVTHARPLSVVLLAAARTLRTVADEPKRRNAAELKDLVNELETHLARQLAGGRPASTTTPEQQSGGRPKHPYIIEHERDGRWIVWGADAAAEAAGTTKGMINVRCSKHGRFERVDTSGDGEWIVSARKATPEEAAEFGTNPA